MASTMAQVKFPNAEDISQNSCTQNDNLDSNTELEFGNGSDRDVKDGNLTHMEQRQPGGSQTEQSNNANKANTAVPVTVNNSSEDEGNKPQQNEPQGDGVISSAEFIQNTQQCIPEKVNYCFESDSDDDFCVLRRSRSDELLELKHHFQAKENTEPMNDFPSPVSEINAKEYRELQRDYARKTAEQDLDQDTTPSERSGYPYGASSASPGNISEEGDRYARDRHMSGGSTCEERIRSIEDEYIRRINTLEERHFELEDVLARLTSSLEPLFETSTSEEDKMDAAEIFAEVEDDNPEVYKEEKEKIEELIFKSQQQKKKFARIVGLELFLEFQRKIRNFAMELNGVLNCSEAAIRHARVVQEWGTSVQLMFEEMKDERMRMQEFIDERERSVMILRNQFASELQLQGRTLTGLVEDMKTYRDLFIAAEKYGGSVEPKSSKAHMAKNIVDFLLKQRLDGEKALILDLKKQSKDKYEPQHERTNLLVCARGLVKAKYQISEMKLMIIHQQSFIQQVQEQNRELRAIIEGLMGAEDYSMDDSERSSTPASAASPEKASLRRSLDRLTEKPTESGVCKISDVLDCDRGETYPGISTDGDLATVQTYGIGKDNNTIDPGEPLVYDPLTVSYIRDQCRAVEETERHHHHILQEQEEENKENIEAEDDVQTFGDGVDIVNIEPFLRKTADKTKDLEVTEEDESSSAEVGDIEAGGDGTDALVKNKVSPLKGDLGEIEDDDDDDSGGQLDIEDIDYVVNECDFTEDIPIAEPPLVDIENTNNNDDLE